MSRLVAIHVACKRGKKRINEFIWLNCLLDDWCSLSNPASFHPCAACESFERIPSRPLINTCLCLSFWNAPAGRDWLRLNVGCVRFFQSVALYLITYWQLLSCRISPAASTASCHGIISRCLWPRPDVKPRGAITVSQFTWDRSHAAFHKGEENTPLCLLFGTTFRTALVTCFVCFAAGKEVTSGAYISFSSLFCSSLMFPPLTPHLHMDFYRVTERNRDLTYFPPSSVCCAQFTA